MERRKILCIIVIGNVEYKLAKSQLAEKNVYDKVGGKVDSKKASNIKDNDIGTVFTNFKNRSHRKAWTV